MPETYEHLFARLRALKPEVAARYKVKEIGLFGSFVRGEQREVSDIDLLVEFDQGADLLDLVGLALFLEGELGRRVVPRQSSIEEWHGHLGRESQAGSLYYMFLKARLTEQ